MDFLNRMVAEAEELEGRVRRLGSAVRFKRLDEISSEQRGLMMAQLKAMQCYLKILESRIYLARVESEEKAP